MGVGLSNAEALFITPTRREQRVPRRAWKVELQRLLMRCSCASTCPTSAGTSKWNKIEHRLFCHITQNWRGKPLRSFETVVELIDTRARRRAPRASKLTAAPTRPESK